jgi:hypothetical protein
MALLARRRREAIGDSGKKAHAFSCLFSDAGFLHPPALQQRPSPASAVHAFFDFGSALGAREAELQCDGVASRAMHVRVEFDLLIWPTLIF